MGPYGKNSLINGIVSGYTASLYGNSNLIVKDIVMNDARNNSDYYCVRARGTHILNESYLTVLYVAGKYACTDGYKDFICMHVQYNYHSTCA